MESWGKPRLRVIHGFDNSVSRDPSRDFRGHIALHPKTVLYKNEDRDLYIKQQASMIAFQSQWMPIWQTVWLVSSLDAALAACRASEAKLSRREADMIIIAALSARMLTDAHPQRTLMRTLPACRGWHWLP